MLGRGEKASTDQYYNVQINNSIIIASYEVLYASMYMGLAKKTSIASGRFKNRF